jgi:hypothetical protein
LLGYVLDPRLDPIEIAEGIAHPTHTIAEGKMGDVGHRRAARGDRLREDRVGIRNVQSEERRCGRPVWAGVEHHHHGVAYPHLGMADAAIGSDEPRDLDGIESALQPIHEAGSVMADHPGRDGRIALGWVLRFAHLLSPPARYVLEDVMRPRC